MCKINDAHEINEEFICLAKKKTFRGPLKERGTREKLLFAMSHEKSFSLPLSPEEDCSTPRNVYFHVHSS